MCSFKGVKVSPGMVRRWSCPWSDILVRGGIKKAAGACRFVPEVEGGRIFLTSECGLLFSPPLLGREGGVLIKNPSFSFPVSGPEWELTSLEKQIFF